MVFMLPFMHASTSNSEEKKSISCEMNYEGGQLDGSAQYSVKVCTL